MHSNKIIVQNSWKFAVKHGAADVPDHLGFISLEPFVEHPVSVGEG